MVISDATHSPFQATDRKIETNDDFDFATSYLLLISAQYALSLQNTIRILHFQNKFISIADFIDDDAIHSPYQAKIETNDSKFDFAISHMITS